MYIDGFGFHSNSWWFFMLFETSGICRWIVMDWFWPFLDSGFKGWFTIRMFIHFAEGCRWQFTFYWACQIPDAPEKTSNLWPQLCLSGRSPRTLNDTGYISVIPVHDSLHYAFVWMVMFVCSWKGRSREQLNERKLVTPIKIPKIIEAP